MIYSDSLITFSLLTFSGHDLLNILAHIFIDNIFGPWYLQDSCSHFHWSHFRFMVSPSSFLRFSLLTFSIHGILIFLDRIFLADISSNGVLVLFAQIFIAQISVLCYSQLPLSLFHCSHFLSMASHFRFSLLIFSVHGIVSILAQIFIAYIFGPKLRLASLFTLSLLTFLFHCTPNFLAHIFFARIFVRLYPRLPSYFHWSHLRSILSSASLLIFSWLIFSVHGILSLLALIFGPCYPQYF